jgi:ribA/ribD-fused uncharacterized protein
MKYNCDQLIRESKAGITHEYILFWGHRPQKDGKIGKSCFSQWFESSFVVEDVKYASAEHWMMAEKARLFNDNGLLPEILNAATPEKVKDLGRKIKNFDDKVWDLHKYNSVLAGNMHKFSQNGALKNYLLSTENKIIVEVSPYDQIWGIGIGKEHPDALFPEKWNGQNLLGFALMEVRNELRNNS